MMISPRAGAWLAPVVLLSGLAAQTAEAATISPFTEILIADQGLDGVFTSRDLNGDGDANDAGERSTYFDAANQSGLVNPTLNVFSVLQSREGDQYIGDGSTDTVYRLRDNNHDGDAQDAGEANVWFSPSNAGGLTLPTPNGIGQGSDGAIYVVNAGTGSQPFDGVYRTRDLNNDGDANDAGEANVWLNLKDINTSSSAFDISFQGSTAFISDTVGGDTNVVYRARDNNNNGTVETSEVSVFIDNNNPFGVVVDFAVSANDKAVFVMEFLDFSGPQSLFKLTDLNGNGTIDDAAEAEEVWNDTALPTGFELFANFDIAVDAQGNIVLTSNGGSASPNQDNVVLLSDLDGNGDYFGTGETIIWTSRALTGDFPDRPRAVAFNNKTLIAVAEPESLALLSAGIVLLAGFSTRRRRAIPLR